MRANSPVAPTLRRIALWVFGAAGFIAIYVWDDVIFAAPILAVVSWLGPWTAFVVLSVVYAIASFGLAMLAVRAYERRQSHKPSRLAEWLDREREKSHGRVAQRVLTAGKHVGFVLSSIFAGGILTTYFLRYAGKTEGLKKRSAISCAIFGVTFVGMYAGIFSILF